MAKVAVDPGALTSHGRALADHAPGAQCSQCQPAASDTVSTAVAASFTAWSSGLDMLISQAALQRANGGLAVDLTGAALEQGDQEAAAHIASGGTTSAPSAAPPLPRGNVEAPSLPVAPPVPAVPEPSTGEVWARTIHGGAGAEPLRTLAQQLRTTAQKLAAVAGDTERAGAGVDSAWDDGDQPAGDNIRRHAQWLNSAADYARQLAASAEAASTTVETARNETPTPETFTALTAQYRKAQQTYASSGGTVTEPLMTATTKLQEAKAQALAAQTQYAAAANIDSTTAPAPPPAPPPIVGGGPSTGDQSDKPAETTAGQKREVADKDSEGDGADTEEDAELAADSAEQPPLDSSTGTDEPGPPPAEAKPPADPLTAAVDPAANTAGEVMGTILGTVGQSAGAASGLMPGSGGGGLPMSALSGLSSIPGLGGAPAMSPPELGSEDDDFDFEDSFGTTPASSGGGGGGGGGGLPAAPSVSAPAAATPGIGAIPPAPPAASAGSAGGAGARMPMGGMMPPMMGGLGGGQTGERDKDLHPDRRVVHRHAANTEAVFGELEQLRKRPSRRRAAATQEGSTGDDTHDDH